MCMYMSVYVYVVIRGTMIEGEDPHACRQFFYVSIYVSRLHMSLNFNSSMYLSMYLDYI